MCVSAVASDLTLCHLPSEIALQCHFIILHIICDTVQTDRAGFCVNPELEDLQVISRIHSEITRTCKSQFQKGVVWPKAICAGVPLLLVISPAQLFEK